jgi:hypothetical protein
MSFDLGVWYEPQPITSDAAAVKYVAFCEGEGESEEHPCFEAFFDELSEGFPSLDEVDEADIDDCPWAAGFERGDGHVLLTIKWSRAEDMAQAVLALAANHELVVFDPQDDEVHLPPRMRRRRS